MCIDMALSNDARLKYSCTVIYVSRHILDSSYSPCNHPTLDDITIFISAILRSIKETHFQLSPCSRRVSLKIQEKYWERFLMNIDLISVDIIIRWYQQPWRQRRRRLGDVDLRLLRVFREINFTNAFWRYMRRCRQLAYIAGIFPPAKSSPTCSDGKHLCRTRKIIVHTIKEIISLLVRHRQENLRPHILLEKSKWIAAYSVAYRFSFTGVTSEKKVCTIVFVFAEDNVRLIESNGNINSYKVNMFPRAMKERASMR